MIPFWRIDVDFIVNETLRWMAIDQVAQERGLTHSVSTSIEWTRRLIADFFCLSSLCVWVSSTSIPKMISAELYQYQISALSIERLHKNKTTINLCIYHLFVYIWSRWSSCDVQMCSTRYVQISVSKATRWIYDITMDRLLICIMSTLLPVMRFFVVWINYIN